MSKPARKRPDATEKKKTIEKQSNKGSSDTIGMGDHVPDFMKRPVRP